MTEAPCVEEVRDVVARAEIVVPVGGRTHWEVGGRPSPGQEVGAPAGIVRYEPADMTVTAGAGTPVRELAAALAAAGQECALDPRSSDSTLGGALAAGLSGHRRLRLGPLRDLVLQIRFVTGDARVVKAGGPTVKNVTGYDLARLLVGSLGTLGVLVEATLRTRPLPVCTTWSAAEGDPVALRARLHAASSILWNGSLVHVLLEGDPGDVEAQLVAGGLARSDGAPGWPDGPHRGRASVRPAAVGALGRSLDGIRGVRWLAEVGVGTIHVAAESAEALGAARAAAEREGGWLLREAGAGELDGFGMPLPNRDLLRRIKDAFDPEGKLNPGRLPL